MKIKAIVKGIETEIELNESNTIKEAIQIALNQVGIINNTGREYTMHDHLGYQYDPNLSAISVISIKTIEYPATPYVFVVPPVGFGG